MFAPPLSGRAKLLAQADAARDAGDIDRAVQIYSYIARADKQDATALSRLAELLLARGRWSQAAQRAREAIARLDNSDIPHTTLASVYLIEGKKAEALSELEKAQAFPDASAKCHSMLADLYCAQGRHELAEREYRRTIEIDRKNAHAFACLSALLEARGDHAQALRICRDGTNGECQDSPQLQLQLGLLYLSDGRQWEAAECFKKARDLDPHDPLAFEMLAVLSGAKNDWASAADFAESLTQVDPGNANARLMLAWATYMAGDCLEAKVQLQQLVEQMPASSQLHNVYGLVLCDLRRLPEAMHEFDQALRLQPDNAAARLNLLVARCLSDPKDSGLLKEATEFADSHPAMSAASSVAAFVAAAGGNSQAATRYAQAALRINDSAVLSHVVLARVSLKAGRADEAIARLKAVMNNTAPTAFLNCELAQAYYEAGQFTQAANHAQTALQLAPSNLAAKRVLALSLGKQGNWDATALFLKEIAARMPKDIEARLSLADALEHKGDLDAARSAYEAASKIDSGSVAAWNGMARLALAAHHQRQARQLARKALELDPRSAEAKRILSCLR
jgi:tetratricopeptide (TPR) repeat protein